jgi:predicted amidohydrolase
MEQQAAAPLAALVQMTSGIDSDANLATIDRAMAAAAAQGASMVFLPEMSLLLDRDRQRSAPHIRREADSAWLPALQAMAQHHGVWLHSGRLIAPMSSAADHQKCCDTCAGYRVVYAVDA